MSDFGATLTLIKHNNREVTTEDRQLVNQELENFKAGNEFNNALGENFIYETLLIANDNTMLWIRLSEYWYGDRDNEENFEFAKENDLPQAEEIAIRLSRSLGKIFIIEAKFENW
ncbi:hypothetical protein [Chryseosolibacter indicus]|uniref:Uncharacterized protein n=1 Tax=Chryseosolibacter indicus TaxID=2782351 RepID=A0ABS5VXA0_9BACT|nr:hypothetical protein [Chryseosolibacter indicus]MBT1705951.1 hypothetical protein [Chryseosolibacter indicus]